MHEPHEASAPKLCSLELCRRELCGEGSVREARCGRRATRLLGHVLRGVRAW